MSSRQGTYRRNRLSRRTTVKALYVALGSKHYRVERPFYRHDGAGRVSDVAVAPDGMIHVLIRHDPLMDESGPAIVTLDSSGQVHARWGTGEISDGHMLRVAPDNRIFVIDRDAHCVAVYRDKRLEATIGVRDAPAQPFNHPTAVAFAPDATTLIADGYAHGFIHRYDSSFASVAKWGSHGRGDGQFRNPHCVWVLPNGQVAVVDRGNDRVQIFSQTGRHLANINDFVQPMGIWGDQKGQMYVSDSGPSLTLIDVELNVVGRCRPVTDGAHGICGDATGIIYLAEPGQGRVSRMVPL